MKKYLPYILISIAVLAPSLVFAGWLNSPVDELLAFLGNMALGVCSWVLFVAAKVFDYAIAISINNSALTAPGSLVDTGWTISRDLANIFFIFILVYIGIATILRIGGYGAKELLVKLILIAIFVNFSLIIAQTIVNATDLLANQFYNAIQTPETTTIKTTAGKTTKVNSISAVFAQGLKPQTIYSVEKTEFGKSGERKTTARQIVIISVFGCVITLIAAFVLFAGGIIFVIRSITLQLLMVLAPLAFIAMILPKTNQYAKEWWTHLLNQSILAPAFLFMFYLTAKIINDGFYKNLLDTKESTFAGIFLSADSSPHIALIIQFITLIILLLGTLTVARKIGGVSAGMGINFATWTRKKAQGYAGRISRRAAGEVVSRYVPPEGRVAAQLRKIPFAAKATANITAANRAKISKIKKGYEKYTAPELKNMMATTTVGFNRAAITQRLAELKDLKPDGKGLTRERIDAGKTTMERYGIDSSPVKGLLWQYAKTDKERKQAIGGASKDTIESIFKAYNKEPKTGKDRAYVKYFTKEMLKEMHRNFKGGQLKTVYDQGGKAAETFFESLSDLGESTSDIAERLQSEEYGNKSFASWMNSPAAQNLSTYGIKSAKKEKKKNETPKRPIGPAATPV